MAATLGDNDPVGLVVKIGQTLAFTVTRQNADKTAKTITGGTYVAKIRPTFESSTLIGTLTCVVTGTNVVSVSLDSTASGSMSAYVGTHGVWDLREILPAGSVILTGGPVDFQQVASR